MMPSDYIVDVNEPDFEYQVLVYSQNIPVVVDFWAEWCAPCRVLGPILEQLATESQGSFRLARVNVDENPNLSKRYTVRSIPAVKAFRNGHVISEFLGAQPEGRVREFIRAIAPSPHDLAIEKGFSLLNLRQVKEAERVFRQVCMEDTANSRALLGLLQTLLLLGHGKEGSQIINGFPASREYHNAEKLRPLATALAKMEGVEIHTAYQPDENPLTTAYRNALRLFVRGNHEAAMDGLLEILRQDKRYHNGEVRQALLGILDLLGDQDLTRQYRNELASILF